MQNDTRALFDKYVAQIAAHNGISPAAVGSKFTVTPSVQQRLETAIQDTSAFLGLINIIGVTEQEAEKIGLGVTGPNASTTDTAAQDRATADLIALDNRTYKCTQTNFDTHITYARIDAWAKFPDFEQRLRNSIIKRQALDRILIGFNGTSRAATSNPATNPLRQDVNIGWLQKMRTEAPARVMTDAGAVDGEIKIGATGDYKNLDALVFDAVNNLIEPWYREDSELVVICGRKLVSDKYFPLLNTTQPPSETLAADVIIASQRIGGLKAITVPYFPADKMLITRLDNLSLYYQTGARRRTILDNARRDRIENYESSNDAYVVEDLGCAALVENITIV